MMPWMCDSLLPIEERYASSKYRRLSRTLRLQKSLRDELVEVRALMLTPGMTRTGVDALMLWPKHIVGNHLASLQTYDEEAMPLAMANWNGATVEDGEAMLTAILENKPSYAEQCPLYVTRYLQHERGRGRKAAELAERFKTTELRIRSWWGLDIFDPLSGARRENTHNGKPIHKTNRKVLGI